MFFLIKFLIHILRLIKQKKYDTLYFYIHFIPINVSVYSQPFNFIVNFILKILSQKGNLSTDKFPLKLFSIFF